MATHDITHGGGAPAADSRPTRAVGLRRLATETKAAFKTTEFYAFLAVLAGLLIAGNTIEGKDGGADYFAADKIWLYVTLLTIGYMVSRGLAKAGSRDPYWDERGDRNASHQARALDATTPPDMSDLRSGPAAGAAKAPARPVESPQPRVRSSSRDRAARIERLRNLIARLEQAPRSRQRDVLLRAMRARVVTLDTGSHGSSAWLSKPDDPLGSLARTLRQPDPARDRALLLVKSRDVVQELGAYLVGEDVGGSGRLELRHLLLDLVVCVIVWSREDERDRLGAEVAAPDEPFISLKDVRMSSRVVSLRRTSSA